MSDVNGVAITVQTVGALARRRGVPLEVLTSLKNPPKLDLELRNFTPVGEFRLPEYEAQKLAFPPFLELIEHCERQGYDELLISTPGPMGLMGLAAARLLGIRATGIYHTDFPVYVRHLTDSETLEELTWKFSRWFFGQMDTLYVPSAHYLERLAERGFRRDTMRLMPRGVDFLRFNPGRRDPEFFRRFGLGPGFKFLYVGRISKEKNLDALLAAFFAYLETGRRGQLVVVGDGPYLEELRSRYPRPEVLFTGYLHGDELATAYASADLFVFPSTRHVRQRRARGRLPAWLRSSRIAADPRIVGPRVPARDRSLPPGCARRGAHQLARSHGDAHRRAQRALEAPSAAGGAAPKPLGARPEAPRRRRRRGGTDRRFAPGTRSDEL